MGRYAIIRQSTDLRRLQTEIEFTTSRRRVQEALSEEPRYVEADPKRAKNWHHIIVEVYELPEGWRKPSRKWLTEEARARSTRDYPRAAEDVLASVIRQVGCEVRGDEGRSA